MYLLLVIYSLFNLWNVSWGTREDPKPVETVSKEKLDEAKAAVKNEGMLSNLLQQLHLQGNGGDQGGLEFSLSNLFKCMCFTHDDPMDPKKQLVDIATSLEKVNLRLSKFEHNPDMGGLGMGRRSSFSKGRRMTPLQEAMIEDDASDIQDEQSYQTEGSLIETYSEETKIERDDLKNPFWLDDFYSDNPIYGGGLTDFLPGAEIVFWKEVIKKYLTPLVMSKDDQAKQLKDLKGYRDQLIFTFIMANLIWVLGISLMQQNKDIMSIPWFLDVKYNVTYNLEGEMGPEVNMMSTSLILEPIGLFFLLAFLGIMVLQMIGMVLHRWTNCKSSLQQYFFPLSISVFEFLI